MRRPSPFWAAAALLPMTVAAAPVEPAPNGAPVQAWIEAQPAGSGQVFTGYVKSAEPFSGRYELVAERQGASGRSSTRQSGQVELAAGERLRMSQLSLAPLGPEDRYSVVLRLLQGETVVAVHQLGAPPAP